MKLEISHETGLQDDDALRDVLKRDGQIALNYALIENEAGERIVHLFSQKQHFDVEVFSQTGSTDVLTAGRVIMTIDEEVNCDHTADDVRFPPVEPQQLALAQREHAIRIKDLLREKLQSLHLSESAV